MTEPSDPQRDTSIQERPRPEPPTVEQGTAERREHAAVLKLLRAVLGWLLLLIGIALLVLPGPGIPLILIGLGLIDLPFSRRIRAWLFTQAERRGWIRRK